MDRDHQSDLPEGVIDADPPGAWESGDVADGETAEQNDAAMGRTSLADSGLPVEDADRTEADPDRASGEPILAPDGDPPSDTFVESAEVAQGMDPELRTDDQAER